MGVCHNRELKTRTILLLFFLAYAIFWLYYFPLTRATDILTIGPKPELENYTSVLRQIPEFSIEIPTYISIAKVAYL
jgi:hypothetical protein